MAYSGYITTLQNVRPHKNADRLLLGECFGNTVCVSLDYFEGQLGLYLPSDGQVSEEFAEKNNLLRKKDAEGKNIGGYMDPNKRNITAIRLRGEKSDGLFLPISCLDYCYESGTAADHLKTGDTITVINGHEICNKYIPKKQVSQRTREGNKTRKHKEPIAPLFAEHADTTQLAYNLDAFHYNDQIEISLKMHGTSQRTGYLPILKGYKRTLLDCLTRKPGEAVYDWGYVSGTRRTVLNDYEGGYYGSNSFREQHSKRFEGKLHKGETVYYEVVGYLDNGAPIMGEVNNSKLNDKEFIKQYGNTTVFSYGCEPNGIKICVDAEEDYPAMVKKAPRSELYVYRMTMTNEDGDVVEYTPDFMRYRCEQMGVKTVPVFAKFYISEIINSTPGEYVKTLAETYFDGPDPIGQTHVREGAVVRIVNRPKFTAYKIKNFSFKVLEGILKLDATEPDIEEAEEVNTESEE